MNDILEGALVLASLIGGMVILAYSISVSLGEPIWKEKADNIITTISSTKLAIDNYQYRHKVKSNDLSLNKLLKNKAFGSTCRDTPTRRCFRLNTQASIQGGIVRIAYAKSKTGTRLASKCDMETEQLTPREVIIGIFNMKSELKQNQIKYIRNFYTSKNSSTQPSDLPQMPDIAFKIPGAVVNADDKNVCVAYPSIRSYKK